AGSSTAVSIAFTPTAAGPQISSLSILSNDPLNPAAEVTITGAAATPASQITVSAATLNFGNVPAGATQTASLTISNAGAVPLTITGLATGGAFSVVSPAVPLTLAPGASTPVVIAVTPPSPGAQSSSLLIASSDPSHSSISVTLLANAPLGPT